MPYIVSVRTDVHGDGLSVDTERKAVATLNEARDIAFNICMEALMLSGPSDPEAPYKAHKLPTDGGSVTLPDGTVIEVERVSWADLAESVNWLGRGYVTEAEWPEVIDAYNNR
jgi:hypothetical protein